MITRQKVIGEFPAQRPVTRSFHVFFNMRLYKRLSKQSWGWWYETPSRPLWLQCDVETFSALLALYAGNSPITGEFPKQRPVARSFDVFSDLRLIKRSSKQSRGWWFETPSRSLWNHCILYPLLGSADATVIHKNICVKHTKWAYFWCYHQSILLKILIYSHCYH